MSDLNLQVQFLAEKAERAGDLPKRLDGKSKELESAWRGLEANQVGLKEQRRDNGMSEMVLKVARSATGRNETEIHDLAKRVCSGSSTLMRVQASSYRDRLNAVLHEALSRVTTSKASVCSSRRIAFVASWGQGLR